MQQPPPPMRVRFDAIGEAWRIYMADVGQWILTWLLAAIVAIAPVFIIQLIVFAVFGPAAGMFSTSAGNLGSASQANAVHTASLVSTLAAMPFNALTQLL